MNVCCGLDNICKSRKISYVAEEIAIEPDDLDQIILYCSLRRICKMNTREYDTAFTF